ncbi:hypothetical protein [Phenylobacterium sp.]|uniref:hypothetical protein n=1 Tax=Phenylobacterium sp. TaxID=1871053 RepID=UPI00374D7F23
MVDARFETEDRTAALIRAEQLDLKETQADVREAYQRGRKDERARRRRHPIGMTLLFVAAACGAALLGLAAINGSFSAGGSVADQSLQDAGKAAQARAASPSK